MPNDAERSKPGPRARFLNEAGRPNTLGLHQRELNELLDQFDIPEAPRKGVRRSFVRWPFRRTTIPVRISQPHGIAATLSVACRNLSRGGMSFLHSAYLHSGTRCTVLLPHASKGEVRVDGWITRCVHRAGMIHEVGLAFAEHIDVREFLTQDPLTDCFSLETIDPELIHGALLHVNASEIDHTIFRHYLRDSRLRIAEALDGEHALARLNEGWDLIVVDLNLPDVDGLDLVRRMRQSTYNGPLIVTTSETGPKYRKRLQSLEANACLPKPLSQSLVLRAIAEFLLDGHRRSNGVETSLQPEHPDFLIAERLVQTLKQIAKKLEDAVGRADAPACRSLCLQVSGTAPSLGFAELGRLAGEAAETLSRTMSVPDSIKPLRLLIAACEHAKVRRAA